MATLPHLTTPRLSLLGGRPRPGNRSALPAAPRVEQRAAGEERSHPAALDVPRPSPAASLVPVLLSLGGLFALTLGAAVTGREIIEIVTGLLSGS